VDKALVRFALGAAVGYLTLASRLMRSDDPLLAAVGLAVLPRRGQTHQFPGMKWLRNAQPCDQQKTAGEAAEPATGLTVRPKLRMSVGLLSDKLLLNLRQQQLPLGQRQTYVGDVAKIIRPAERHHLETPGLTLSPPLISLTSAWRKERIRKG
jgi:hypothetical protein